MCIKLVFISYKTISNTKLINYLKFNFFLCQIYFIHVQNYKCYLNFVIVYYKNGLFILYLIIFIISNLE